MPRVETPDLKTVVAERFKRFPVMNRSMLSVTFTSCPAKQLTEALDELVKEGVLIEGKYATYRQITPLYYLSEEASRLEHYVTEAKK